MTMNVRLRIWLLVDLVTQNSDNDVLLTSLSCGNGDNLEYIGLTNCSLKC